MTQTGKPLNQTQKAALDVRILKDVSWTPFLAVAGFKAHSAPSSSQSGKGCKQWRVSNSDAHDSLSACAGRSPRGGGSVARQYRHRRDRRLASAPARGQRSFAPAGRTPLESQFYVIKVPSVNEGRLPWPKLW
jgi:hypothetical protein